MHKADIEHKTNAPIEAWKCNQPTNRPTDGT